MINASTNTLIQPPHFLFFVLLPSFRAAKKQGEKPRKKPKEKTKKIQNPIVGSSLKNVTWLPLPWTSRRPPCDAWRSSFHSGRNSVRPMFHLLQTFHTRACYRMGEEGDSTSPVRHVQILWQRLPGEHPQPTIQIPRTAWLVRHSRFARSISAHNQKANSDNTDDQVS